MKSKGKTLMQVFVEERHLIADNLHEVVRIIDAADRAKECVLLSDDEAARIRELVGKVIVQFAK